MKKLEIGPKPGKKIDPSWDTLDIQKKYKPTIVADFSEPLIMIKTNTYDLIYASHILEHAAWYKSVPILKEFNRILKPQGTVEIWVPDFERIIQVYLTGKMGDKWRMRNPHNNPMLWVLGRIFAHDRYGTNENCFHRAAFDAKHLRKCLKNAGFINIKKLKKPRAYDHGWINLGMSGEKQ